MFRLVVLFLVIPLVEFTLLIQIGEIVGLLPTIVLVVVTGLVGGILARQQGLSTWKRFNSRLADGKLPGKELADGVIILVAGALLITPGLLTDLLGLCGLIPFTRRPLQQIMMRRLMASVGGVGTMIFDQETPAGSPDRRTDQSRWGGTPRSRPQHADSHDKKSRD